MKQRFTAEQIVGILQEAEGKDAKVRDICRQHGVTEQTFYRWRKVYGGLPVSEAKRLKALEEENRRLKRLVAEQALDLAMLKDVAGRKW
jgi:putative transposase